MGRDFSGLSPHGLGRVAQGGSDRPRFCAPRPDLEHGMVAAIDLHASGHQRLVEVAQGLSPR